MRGFIFALLRPLNFRMLNFKEITLKQNYLKHDNLKHNKSGIYRHRFLKISLTVIILLSVINSCGRVKKTDLIIYGNNISDQPDNNTIKNSTNFKITNTLVGFFNNTGSNESGATGGGIGDRDYYRLEFPDIRSSYRVICTSVPGIDYKLTVLTGEGRALYSVDAGRKGEAERIWDLYPSEKWDTILLVESKYGFNERVPYIINFINNGIDNRNEREPNNSIDEAEFIGIPGIRRGFIAPANDIDYYIIRAGDQIKDFSVRVETLSYLDISFTIIDTSNNMSKTINQFGWGGNEYFGYLATGKGDHILQVTGNTRPGETKDPIYYIYIEEHQPLDNKYFEREFNDTIEKAASIINNSEMAGALYPENDIDYFFFDSLYNNANVSISLSSIKGLDTVMELYNHDGIPLDSSDNNPVDGSEELGTKVKDKGRYYIKLYAKKGSSVLAYNLYFNIRY